MILDLRTMFAFGAVTCIILAVMQFVAFATGRFERWPLWWAISNLLIGLGVIGTALRGILSDFVTIVVANTVLWTGSLALLMGLRRFGARPMRLPVYVMAIALPAALLALWLSPDDFPKRLALVSLLLAACDIAIIREGLRLLRIEKLRSAAILIALFAATALMFLIRAGNALFTDLGNDLFPATPGAQQWFVATGIAFILLRSNALLLLAMERSRNALLFLAQHDPLTGALNRNGLALAMSGGVTRRRVKPGQVTLVLIDIDHFKQLNDTHGHAAGDDILRLFTESAQAALPDSAMLARQGGDEFACLLPGMAVAEAVRVADRVRECFGRNLSKTPGIAVFPTLSIGIAEGDSSDTLDTLLRRADQALYRSKRLGRDRVQVQAKAMAA